MKRRCLRRLAFVSRSFILSLLTIVAVARQDPSEGTGTEGAEPGEEERQILLLWNRYQELLAEEKWDAALEAAALLYDSARYTMQPDDRRLGALAINYANLLNRQGHERQAREVMERARRRYEELYAPDSPEMVSLLIAEGDLLANPYDATPQKRKYQEALRITADSYGRRSEQYAELALTLGVKLMDLSRSVEGERFLKDALKIFRKQFGDEDPRTGKASFYVGRLVYGKGRRGSAETYMRDALQAFDPETEAGRSWLMIVRRGLITIYRDSGNDSRLTEQLQEIGRLWAVQNPDDPAPVLLIRVEPEYPDTGALLPRTGEVEFEVTVDEEGYARSPRVVGLTGDEAFVAPALQAIRQYRFVPRYVDGSPVAVAGVRTTVTFSPLN